MDTDPFALLGLPPDATAQDVRRTIRDLAKRHHPDRGGDGERMREVNAAAVLALERIAARGPSGRGPSGRGPAPTRRSSARWEPAPGPTFGSSNGRRTAHDVASFTIETLPAEAFEALLVVTSWIGEVAVDDPPYLLEVHLHDPLPCWCRLDLVPDAGSCTVGLTVAAVEGGPLPDIDTVRDRWVAGLNELGGRPLPW